MIPCRGIQISEIPFPANIWIMVWMADRPGFGGTIGGTIDGCTHRPVENGLYEILDIVRRVRPNVGLLAQSRRSWTHPFDGFGAGGDARPEQAGGGAGTW